MHARGSTKSALETLIMEDCTALLELPDKLSNNLVSLQMLNLRGCYNMVACKRLKLPPAHTPTALPITSRSVHRFQTHLPEWLRKVEEEGAVMRPYHLE